MTRVQRQETTIVLDVARTNRIKDLFSEALELDDAGRTALLSRAAAEDPAIECELRLLIGAHSRASEFLREPTAGANSPLDRDARSPVGEAVGDTIDRYQLLEVIGEGGFGRVYRAVQREPVARTVALKVIKAGMDTRQVIARFQAERQALALMDHPGIATVFDAGTTSSGRPYFVMELVSGQAITAHCDEHRLTIDQRLELFRQVCAAVQHAHAKGVVHRDLKPSNVLVTMIDGQPQPKVIDFGIAKAVSALTDHHATLTEQHQPIGTPEYMSPEQAGSSAADIDTRSDVYALGVLLYQLLRGTTPFDGERLRQAGFAEMQRIIREEDPPRPSERLAKADALDDIAAKRDSEPHRLIAKIRDDLDWITLKALRKDREQRYGTPMELADDLRRHLEHEPVLAGPPSAAYRTRKFVRRHRAAAVAVSVMTAAILAGGIGATLGMLKARVAAARERDAGQQAAAINEFMRSVLTSASPERLGAQVRLADVVNEAEADVAERFAGHPMLEAEMRDVLATAYQRLSLWNQAANQSEIAASLWNQAVGSDDPRAMESTIRQAVSLVNMQRGREAQRLLDDVLPRLEAILGPDDPKSFEARALLGEILKVRGRLDESEQLLRATIERATNLGIADQTQAPLLSTLTSVLRARMHEDRQRTLPAIDEYSRCAQALLAIGQRMGRAGDWHTFAARQHLADVAVMRGTYEDAAAQCRSLLDDSRDRLGECHVIRVWAMNTLAEAQWRLGQMRESADLSLRVIECARTRMDGGGPVLLSYLSDALLYLECDQRWAQAEACCREAITLVKGMDSHVDSYYLESRLAHFVSHQDGRMDEADAMFRSLVARGPETVTASDHAWMLIRYADHLMRRGEFEEAEAALNTVRESGALTIGLMSPHPPDDLLHQFIVLYQAWGKPDKAAEFERLLDDKRAALADRSQAGR